MKSSFLKREYGSIIVRIGRKDKGPWFPLCNILQKNEASPLTAGAFLCIIVLWLVA